MYDRNGLELTPVQNSLNAYKFTAVNVKGRNYTAYAQATRFKGLYSMVTIGKFADARDAAFVAQQFALQYNEEQVYQMALDKTFAEVAKQFVDSVEIPEWEYPAEGLDWDDILGGNEDGKKNRVADAREALIEALKSQKKQVPAIAIAKQMIAKVEDMYKSGVSYREAAKTVVSQH